LASSNPKGSTTIFLEKPKGEERHGRDEWSWTPIHQTQRMLTKRTRVLAVVIVLILVATGFGCALAYIIPLSKVRVGHLSLELPEGWTYKRNYSSGSLYIYPSRSDYPNAWIDIVSSSEMMNNESLYYQMKNIAEDLGSTSKSGPPFSTVIAPHNTTIHGTMANDAVFRQDYIGGVVFWRVVVLGSPDWHTIWCARMRSASVAHGIIDYNDTNYKPVYESIVETLRVEGSLPMLLKLATVSSFAAATFVLLLLISLGQGRRQDLLGSHRQDRPNP